MLLSETGAAGEEWLLIKEPVLFLCSHKHAPRFPSCIKLKGDAFLEMFCKRQRHFNVNLFSCERIIVRTILLFFFLACAYVKLFDRCFYNK